MKHAQILACGCRATMQWHRDVRVISRLSLGFILSRYSGNARGGLFPVQIVYFRAVGCGHANRPRDN